MSANPRHDALRHATATTLREDAAYVRTFAYPPMTVHDLRLCRLASLAEAVATMQERGDEAYLHDRQRGTWAIGRTFTADATRADSLPAALAAMLDAEGT